jgi:hypothetical protein
MQVVDVGDRVLVALEARKNKGDPTKMIYKVLAHVPFDVT